MACVLVCLYVYAVQYTCTYNYCTERYLDVCSVGAIESECSTQCIAVFVKTLCSYLWIPTGFLGELSSVYRSGLTGPRVYHRQVCRGLSEGLWLGLSGSVVRSVRWSACRCFGQEEFPHTYQHIHAHKHGQKANMTVDSD